MNALRKSCVTILIFSAIALMSCNSDVSVNKGLIIPDGTEHQGALSSVNGSIRVGDDCRISGDCTTVNGSVTVGDRSFTGSLNSVNGGVTVGKATEVAGEISSVNGNISLAASSKVSESITTVNGSFKLTGATVSGNLETVNGNILLTDHAHVGGDIIISDTHGLSGKQRKMEIRVEDGSVVDGSILVEDEDADVTVYLSADSKIGGSLENARLVKEDN